MDKSLILNRIIQYKNFKSDAEFARFLDITPQNFSKWKQRGTYDIELLYKKCPELSPEWLLTGKGSMLKSENILKNKEIAQPENVNNLLTESLLHTIEVQKKLIEKLEVEISILKEKNKG